MTQVDALTAWWRARQLRVNAGATDLASKAWLRNFDANDIGAWSQSIPGMVRMTQAGMTAAATGASGYVATAVSMQGASPSSDGTVDPEAFAQTAADGRPLGSLLYVPAINVQARLDAGMATSDAVDAGLRDLLMLVGTEVADAGRQAVSASMVSDRSVTGFIRVPGPACCARCAILADKWYSTYEGASFERHPFCMCTAAPAVSNRNGPTRFDASRYFDGLSKANQDRVFTKAGADAIRDGADMNQVVNARSGVNPIGWTGRDGTGWTTTVGTGKGSTFASSPAGMAGKPRLTTEAIYRLSSTREEAASMLREYGYVL